MKRLQGLIAAAFTPFRDGTVATDPIPPYARCLAGDGVSGVFVNGTTGESLSLTTGERVRTAEAWLAAAPKELKVIIHVGHNSLPACREMAAHAQTHGAWAVSAMAPSFFKPSVDELVDYCAKIAEAAPGLPFYYYHIPSMTGVSFPVLEFLKRAAPRIPTLAGVKFTWENLMDFGLCIDHEDGRFDMVFGRDEILLCGLVLGARAAIGSTYNFAAPLYHAIFAAFESGRREEAVRLQRLAMKAVAECVAASPRSPLSAIRAMTAQRMGIDLGPPREPMAPMSPASADALGKRMETLLDGRLCRRADASA